MLLGVMMRSGTTTGGMGRQRRVGTTPTTAPRGDARTRLQGGGERVVDVMLLMSGDAVGATARRTG